MDETDDFDAELFDELWADVCRRVDFRASSVDIVAAARGLAMEICRTYCAATARQDFEGDVDGTPV